MLQHSTLFNVLFHHGRIERFVLGKTALLYFDGKKKEAVCLFLWTVGFLILFAIVALVVLLLSHPLPQ